MFKRPAKSLPKVFQNKKGSTHKKVGIDVSGEVEPQELKQILKFNKDIFNIQLPIILKKNWFKQALKHFHKKPTSRLIKTQKINYSKKLKEFFAHNQVKISIIIPAYNEAPRIEHVLKIACNYKYAHEVVVINDGSTDNTAEVVQNFAQNCPKLVFLDLKKNQGKTRAVVEGITKAKGNLIIMLDADLQGLSYSYLDKMVYLVLSKQYDMVILDRLTDRLSPFGLLGIARLFGGERILWKAHFLQAIDEVDLSNVKGYALESILNNYFIKTGKKVRTVLAPDLKAEWQLKKWSLPTALIRYAKEFWTLYKENGIKNFYLQLTEVQDDPIAELYELNNKVKESFKNKFKTKWGPSDVLRAGILVATGIASLGVIGYLLTRQAGKKVKEGVEKLGKKG